jgi:hypothetical protein
VGYEILGFGVTLLLLLWVMRGSRDKQAPKRKRTITID